MHYFVKKNHEPPLPTGKNFRIHWGWVRGAPVDTNLLPPNDQYERTLLNCKFAKSESLIFHSMLNPYIGFVENWSKQIAWCAWSIFDRYVTKCLVKTLVWLWVAKPVFIRMRRLTNSTAAVGSPRKSSKKPWNAFALCRWFFDENGKTVTVDSENHVATIMSFLKPKLRKRRNTSG